MVFKDPKDALAWSAAVVAGALALNLSLAAFMLSACVVLPARTEDHDCERVRDWARENASWTVPVSAIVFGPWRQIFRIP